MRRLAPNNDSELPLDVASPPDPGLGKLAINSEAELSLDVARSPGWRLRRLVPSGGSGLSLEVATLPDPRLRFGKVVRDPTTTVGARPFGALGLAAGLLESLRLFDDAVVRGSAPLLRETSDGLEQVSIRTPSASAIASKLASVIERFPSSLIFEVGESMVI